MESTLPFIGFKDKSITGIGFMVRYYDLLTDEEDYFKELMNTKER